MPTNLALKIAILQSPWTMKKIAEGIEITPMRLSKIVGGYTKATKKEKGAISQVLGVSKVELFGEKEEQADVAVPE